MTSMSLRARVGLSAAVALVLTVTACGGDGGGDEAQDPVTVTTTVPPSPTDTGATDGTTESPSMPTSAPTSGPEMTISPTGEVDAEMLAEDLDFAVEVTSAYWDQHFNDFFTGDYTPPNVVGLYDGNDPASAPQCFGEPLPAGNAFYCPDGDFVAWDQTLIELGYEIGDSWPYLIVAHEWGHAIQARLVRKLRADQLELQADCLAGAALYGAAEDPDIGLQFEEGDEKEIIDALNLLGDETPWTMSGDHGDSFQRIDSFNRGRQGGVPACLPQ